MRKRILCVDDDPESLRVAVRALEREGHEVTTATNGASGLEAALAQRFDLIITDVRMPELDGYALLEKLKQNPKTQAVPVLVVTVRTSPLAERTATLYGADSWLQKPFQLPDLLQRVAQLLDGKKG